MEYKMAIGMTCFAAILNILQFDRDKNGAEPEW